MWSIIVVVVVVKIRMIHSPLSATPLYADANIYTGICALPLYVTRQSKNLHAYMCMHMYMINLESQASLENNLLGVTL